MRTPHRRRAAAALAAVLLLGVAGCGTATDEDAASGSPSSDVTAGKRASSPANEEAVAVAVVTGTAAGGRVDPTPMPLSTPEQVQAFVARFANQEFVARIESEVAAAEVGEGRSLVGAVLSVGCEVPVAVEAQGPPGALRITPVMPGRPTPQECFAPMTTVGLMAVPDAMLGWAGPG